MYKLTTTNDYDFYEVLSAIQKAIRRNEPKIAGYFALELFASGYSKALWKRLITISAEDCYGLITREIISLYTSFNLVNEGSKTERGRVFISKAVLLLCSCPKSRDSDHMGILLYDGKQISDEEINTFLKELSEEDKMEIPDYAYDVHTLRGKRMGKTKSNFIVDEYKSLTPRQTGILDFLVEEH